MSSKAVVPFLIGMMLLTGVCNTLLTKYQDMQCVADCNSHKPRNFEQPVLQTLQMFVGESGCWLVVLLSWLSTTLRRAGSTTPAQDVEYTPVAGDEDEARDDDSVLDGENTLSSSQTLVDPSNLPAKALIDGAQSTTERKPLKGWKVFLLALPAVCDICGTTLMNAGLLLVAPSIYQMTRGALVLFVGLMSVIFLKRHLGAWKWGSLFIVVAGVAVVGLAGALEKKHSAHANMISALASIKQAHIPGVAKRIAKDMLSTKAAHTAAETTLGVLMIAGAQIFTASQFVLEESIMEHYSMDPLQVVGWEGTFGFVVTLLAMGILHAVIGSTPAGRGGIFDAEDGFRQMFTHRMIAITSVLIMISIGGFNFFGLSVTRRISATARSTIDTCRTLFIWLVSLGLGWETFKWLQVLGFVLLVYGTGLFNEIISPPTVSWLRKHTLRRDRPGTGEVAV
ncbi:hypothetical protein AMS68_001045 [Peltaster fructicola]|uniref:EamA domain-containing protein n=1 Tax=Peltaster fructicola TaxID=286661 RepID=A0A6H0XLM3_9PEZI|nr:hypothetical protein AMS68_001045 [Peltaster fructicola]